MKNFLTILGGMGTLATESYVRLLNKKTEPNERKHHEEQHFQPGHQRQPRFRRSGLRPVRTRQGQRRSVQIEMVSKN